MTNFSNNNMGSRFTATLLAVMFSAVTVLGSVGPAYTSAQNGKQVTAHAIASGETANTLA